MKVRFTRPAQRELTEIHAYIGQDSPDIASRVVARLIEHSQTLADNPFAGRETDEPNTRVIVATSSSTPLKPPKFTLPISATHRGVVRVAGADKRRFPTYMPVFGANR